MSHSPEDLEGAQISHSLAMILSAAPDQHHNGECVKRNWLGLSEGKDSMRLIRIRI